MYMTAVRIHRFGGPEALRVETIEAPEPKPDEVLVKVRTASVNPIDYKIRSGAFPTLLQQLPKVLGRDIAGEIVRCGTKVKGWAEGDAVYAMLEGGAGAYAEYATVRADLCARKPAHLDFEAAAAVPLAGLTAWQGEIDHGELHAGQRELIHGGAGGVGHLAIQFAKARGATVCTTVARDDFEFVRKLGADEVIDYQSERFEDILHDIDLVFDLIGGATQDRSWAVLKDGGTIVSSLAKPSEAKAREHHARAEHFVTRPDGGELTEIGALVEAGKVRPFVMAVYPLAEVARAHEQAEHAHVRGKIVLRIN